MVIHTNDPAHRCIHCYTHSSISPRILFLSGWKNLSKSVMMELTLNVKLPTVWRQVVNLNSVRQNLGSIFWICDVFKVTTSYLLFPDSSLVLAQPKYARCLKWMMWDLLIVMVTLINYNWSNPMQVACRSLASGIRFGIVCNISCSPDGIKNTTRWSSFAAHTD